MIEQAIKEYYGERCSDHDDDCVVCQAWEQWDQLVQGRQQSIAPHIRNRLKETEGCVALTRALKL